MAKLEPGVGDILIRSRFTLLQILEERGYDTTPYQNIAPEQILTLAGGASSRALDIVVNRKDGSGAPCERAVVIYMLHDAICRSLFTFTRDIYTDSYPTKKDDVIVLVNEPFNEVFDKTSLSLWQQPDKCRMTFFHIKQMVVHLGKHVLVPPHRKLSSEEAKTVMDYYNITQKSQFPLIKHNDIQAKLLGLVPGDLVEILRPSPTAGVSRVLRICAA